MQGNSVKFFAKEMLEERIENNIRKDILYKNYKEFGYKNKNPTNQNTHLAK